MQKRLYNSIGEFSKKTFSDSGSVEHLLKLKQEADEAIKDPDNIKEYADILIALLGASYKANFTFEELMNATKDKLKVLKKREWIKQEDGTYQHKKNDEDIELEEWICPACNNDGYLGKQHGFTFGEVCCPLCAQVGR